MILPTQRLLKPVSKTWRLHLRAILLAVAGTVLPAVATADVIATADSLLSIYQKATAQQKYQQGLPLMEIYRQNDAYHDEEPHYAATLPPDSLDLAVWFGAACLYYNYGYFEESTAYSRRALPLAEKHHPHIYATVLCDLGYTLYKTGQSAEATRIEHQAVEASKQADNLLQLSRAYLYLAIINLSAKQYDEAKWFVQKAIETNDEMGLNGNTHNTLGIACDIYGQAGDAAQAIDYGKRAVEAAREIGFDAGVVNHLIQLSYSYNSCDSFEMGIKMCDQALGIIEAMPNPDRSLLALCLEYKAYNLNDLKRYEEAVTLLRRGAALQEEMGNARELCADMNELYKALLHIDSTQAMAALQRYTQLHDSIYHDDLNRELSQANAQLHNDDLQDENSTKRRQIRLLLGGITLLLVATGAFYWYVRCNNRRQKSLILDLLGQLEQYRNAPPTTEEVEAAGGNALLPNAANEQFLGEVNKAILRLMPQGKADIGHVASELCMTPSKLRRRMQECTDLTPANYILTIRMDEAKRMLAAYPQHTVGEVAYQCGFADQAHFSRAFSRLFGITPMQFAKSANP